VWREEKERRIEQTDIRVDEQKTFTENIFSLQTRTKQQKRENESCSELYAQST
jgi:hypothetical protein